ncbi:uncharacterized protein [Rhodnius prolixus]
MEYDGAENVRNRMRESTCAERAKRRKERYKLQRQLSYTSKEKEKVLDENDVLAAALSITNSSGDKIEPLKVLKESFIDNMTHIVTFMKVEGASHTLIKYLLSQNSMEQLLAMECCCNLSLGDTKTCFKLAKGATPYLINILHGFNYNLMNVALLTLGNLSGSGKKTCQILHRQGVLNSFDHTIKIAELREATAKAMIMFTKNYLNELSHEESLSVVKSCLPYYETSAHIQWLLYHFSSLAYIKPLLISEQLPNRIIRYLSRLTSIQADNIIPITAQVRTVAFLSTDPDGNTVNVLLDNWDITLRIIKFLMRSNYRHLCKELFWSLGNIIRHNSPEIKSKLATKADDLRSVISFVPVL